MNNISKEISRSQPRTGRFVLDLGRKIKIKKKRSPKFSKHVRSNSVGNYLKVPCALCRAFNTIVQPTSCPFVSTLRFENVLSDKRFRNTCETSIYYRILKLSLFQLLFAVCVDNRIIFGGYCLIWNNFCVFEIEMPLGTTETCNVSPSLSLSNLLVWISD